MTLLEQFMTAAIRVVETKCPTCERVGTAQVVGQHLMKDHHWNGWRLQQWLQHFIETTEAPDDLQITIEKRQPAATVTVKNETPTKPEKGDVPPPGGPRAIEME